LYKKPFRTIGIFGAADELTCRIVAGILQENYKLFKPRVVVVLRHKNDLADFGKLIRRRLSQEAFDQVRVYEALEDDESELAGLQTAFSQEIFASVIHLSDDRDEFPPYTLRESYRFATESSVGSPEFTPIFMCVEYAGKETNQQLIRNYRDDAKRGGWLVCWRMSCFIGRPMRVAGDVLCMLQFVPKTK
jgi:hypothetical protein